MLVFEHSLRFMPARRAHRLTNTRVEIVAMTQILIELRQHKYDALGVLLDYIAVFCDHESSKDFGMWVDVHVMKHSGCQCLQIGKSPADQTKRLAVISPFWIKFQVSNREAGSGEVLGHVYKE